MANCCLQKEINSYNNKQPHTYSYRQLKPKCYLLNEHIIIILSTHTNRFYDRTVFQVWIWQQSLVEIDSNYADMYDSNVNEPSQLATGNWSLTAALRVCHLSAKESFAGWLRMAYSCTINQLCHVLCYICATVSAQCACVGVNWY